MGQYKCHHVAAALLFGYKKASKTDVKCSWMKRPKSAPPKATVTMSKLYPEKQTGYRYIDIPVNYFEILLYSILALHWILLEEPASQAAPVPLVEDLLQSHEYLSASQPHTWLLGKQVLSTDEIKSTASVTSGQRVNAVWAAVRKLRFTASNLGQIISAAKRNRMTLSLETRLLSSYKLENQAPIQWGITHDRNAIDDYCKAGSATVLPTGIWLHQSGILGASPDGLVQGEYSGPFHLQRKKQQLLSPDIIEIK
ncbi:uncharacterized protein LOC127837557 [Dreissena polymorpha]|uniref:uncharacterized protein LOC127837557 n=1 Tax=Dreissena polymorpha TaxID=45954 RepID=UPI0022655C71|nr:uncharacterized protein LOC127837557 [Dreissena polymorpha]